MTDWIIVLLLALLVVIGLVFLFRGQGTVAAPGSERKSEGRGGGEEPGDRNLEETRSIEILESVFTELGDGCFIVDRRLVVVLANEKVRDLFVVPERPIGRKLQDVVLDHRLVDLTQECLQEQEVATSSFELRETPKDGKERRRYVRVTVTPLNPRVHSADTGYLRILVTDITDQRETEQIRKDFVANASHELRTPLSIINGYLENLVDGVMDDPASIKRALQTMQKHGDRIARIVEDMLTISKFESGDLDEVSLLRESTFDCGECLRDVVERLSPVIEEKNASVQVDVPSGQSDIAGDRFYWDQVFFNLIENALKENNGSGLEVDVALRKSPDGTAIITIGDNGVGIPSSDLPYVFKRFYRVAKHHSKEVKGTGLGLSIVKRAVEAHGGAIELSSTPGVRTEFKITLPPPPAPEEGEDDSE